MLVFNFFCDPLHSFIIKYIFIFCICCKNIILFACFVKCYRSFSKNFINRSNFAKTFGFFCKMLLFTTLSICRPILTLYKSVTIVQCTSSFSISVNLLRQTSCRKRELTHEAIRFYAVSNNNAVSLSIWEQSRQRIIVRVRSHSALHIYCNRMLRMHNLECASLPQTENYFTVLNIKAFPSLYNMSVYTRVHVGITLLVSFLQCLLQFYWDRVRECLSHIVNLE